MDLLLDTHVWVWAAEQPSELGSKAGAALADRRNALFVSTVSSLELARLAAGGKLAVRGSIGAWIADSVLVLGLQTVPPGHEIAVAAYALAGDFHPDPADRILVATARLHGLTLVTADQRLLNYPHVRTLDARS